MKFRFEANLSWGHIRRTVILKWGSLDSALTPAMKTAVKNALKNEVAAAWSNNHLMRITDPICGTKTLPVLARVLWNPDDTSDTHHYTVNLSKAPRTSNVTGSNINLDHDSDLADNAWTLKHEFGHALGLPDEYFYSGVTSATVGYKRADGSTVQVTLEPAAAVMQTRGNTTVKKRYLYTDEIEAQELLRAQSGRSVTCRIV